MKESISNAVIRRLPIYLRLLELKKHHGFEKISSQMIGDELGFKPTQVRKDLSYFGDFGQKGVGYNVVLLVDEIKKILKLDKNIPVCLVGYGRLGQAIADYNLFLQDNMGIKAIFDSNKGKIGKKYKELTIHPTDELVKTAKKMGIKIGVITVPQEHAQEVADKMVKAGIKAILNFAPVSLNVPKDVRVRDLDCIAELRSLAYFIE